MVSFDFPVLSNHFWKEGLSLHGLGKYLYCDSLEVLQILSKHSEIQMLLPGDLNCLKLQCLGRDLDKDVPDRAHRAFDDAKKLKSVISKVALRL